MWYRLAEYEDTGLTPEEIKAMLGLIKAMNGFNLDAEYTEQINRIIDNLNEVHTFNYTPYKCID